jgi:hypothetical protein
MFDQTTTHATTATLVVHGSGATVFGAVGEPVPSNAQMGLAEQRARLDLAQSGRASRAPATTPVLRWSPAGAR